MHYLLLGLDADLKDRALQQLKAELFASSDMLKFDYDVLDGDGRRLRGEDLQKAFLALPVLAPQRLIHIRVAEKLSKENLELVLAFLKEGDSAAVLVLDAAEWDGTTKTRGAIQAMMKVVGAVSEAGPSTFRMMDAVTAGRASAALLMLKKILDDGTAEEWILGGMRSSWVKFKSGVSADKYKKGLLVLQEADIALKRSRYPSRENVLEVTVVKLASLALRVRT
ncbi:MAG: hypothetical protein HQL19_05580 [Candidatus Omnitrophica bacterium]|nr:hypothetical protein [Candidatus Omnitrophota bacterium]